MNKMKENFSGLGQFAQRHLVETLTWAAIILAVFSAWSGMFIGTLGWSLVIMIIGAGAGIFFPRHMDMGMKRVYGFSRGSRQVTPIIAEIVKLAVALFLPFLYFGFLGIMAGTAYQYYIRNARLSHEEKMPK